MPSGAAAAPPPTCDDCCSGEAAKHTLGGPGQPPGLPGGRDCSVRGVTLAGSSAPVVSGEGSDCQPQMLAIPCECALSACTSLAAAPLRAWLLAAHGVIIAARP